MSLPQLMRSILLIYLPLTVGTFALFVITGNSAIFPLAALLIILQAIAVEISNRLDKDSLISKIQLDFGPFAAILFGYYHGIIPALILMTVLLVILDIDRDVSVFSEIDDYIFNVIVAILARVLSGFGEFWTLALLLMAVRYFGLTLVGAIVQKEFNPRKFMLEGASGIVFVIFFRIMQLIAG